MYDSWELRTARAGCHRTHVRGGNLRRTHVRVGTEVRGGLGAEDVLDETGGISDGYHQRTCLTERQNEGE